MSMHSATCAKAHDHSKACNCHLADRYPPTEREDRIKPCPVEGCAHTVACRHPSDPHCARTVPKAKEQVNHPSHYGGDTTYETIKVLAAWSLGFLLGNTVKYISRAGKKDPRAFVEDLKKARWYLDQAITRLERGEALF